MTTKCPECNGRGYYIESRYEVIGGGRIGRLKIVDRKKIECPNCTANRKDAVTDPDCPKQRGE